MFQSSQKSYTYDDFDRLASDGDVAYTYDAAGNRMARTEDGETITYTLGSGDRLASYGRAASTMPPHLGAYTHDAAGNVTRIERDGRPTLDLTWNSQYQLVSVSTNGVFAESYTYDALSRRVSTTTLEGTTRHVYDDNWQVIADINANGSVVASYVWGEGIDNLLAVNISGATYYPLTDVQGTVWGYVDSQNNIVAYWQYDAWGNVLSEYVAPSATALATLRYRFQGREWSAATGLINFRMRWYDAETGRWLSKDPIGLSGGLNLYAFCGNSPQWHCDYLGLAMAPFAIGGIAGAIAGGVVGWYIRGGKGAAIGAVAGGIGGVLGTAAAGMLVRTFGATASSMIGGAVAGAISESLRQIMDGCEKSISNVAISALMSGTFAFAGPWSIGIASGIWSEFWSLYYNFLKNEK